MKLKYFFVCILAAASLTVSPEIVLAHGEAVMVGEAAVTDLADSAGRGDLFLVGEITVALAVVAEKSAVPAPMLEFPLEIAVGPGSTPVLPFLPNQLLLFGAL
jgi:hypothetical protein